MLLADSGGEQPGDCWPTVEASSLGTAGQIRRGGGGSSHPAPRHPPSPRIHIASSEKEVEEEKYQELLIGVKHVGPRNIKSEDCTCQAQEFSGISSHHQAQQENTSPFTADAIQIHSVGLPPSHHH